MRGQRMSGSERRRTGRPAEWSRRVVVPWMLCTGALAAVAFLVAAALFPGLLAQFLVLLAVAAAFVLLGAVRVTVTGRGVTVRSVVLPLLCRRIPLSRISSATSGRARPRELGGWGYRWLPGRTAVSLRAGDALWLQLAGGREFVVTVDDAGAAAQSVNAHLAPGPKER